MKIIQLRVGMVGTNCYIVYDENTMQGAVVDPGDQAASILQTAERSGVTLTHILLTHGHFDHILAVHEIWEKTHAQYICPKEDLWLLHREAMGEFKPYAKKFEETPVDVEAVEGTEIKIGSLTAKYLHTPGHTPGSSCILIENVLFTGDTMFRCECGRCDLQGGSFPKMLTSLKRLSELPGNYQVLPGHDQTSTLDYEREHNPYVQQALAK